MWPVVGLESEWPFFFFWLWTKGLNTALLLQRAGKAGAEKPCNILAKSIPVAGRWFLGTGLTLDSQASVSNQCRRWVKAHWKLLWVGLPWNPASRKQARGILRENCWIMRMGFWRPVAFHTSVTSFNPHNIVASLYRWSGKVHKGEWLCLHSKHLWS